MAFISHTNKNVLFFHKSITIDCGIYSLWEKLKRKEKSFFYYFRNRYNFLLMQQLRERYSDHIKNDLLAKIIIFGYKDKEYPIIQTIENNKFLEPIWFDKNTNKSFGVFFVPEGAVMLNEPNWRNTFNSWVSFKNKFDFLNGLPLSENESMKIFPKFFKAIYKLPNAKVIKEEFDKVIEDSIERIALKNDNDDMVLTVLKLRINKANLEYQIN